MYIAPHLIRGRTHVETVYMTLLEHVLSSKMGFMDFIKLFIDYVYRSVIKPLLVKNPSLNKHFKVYVERAFKLVYPIYIRVNVDLVPPSFEKSDEDPYIVCIRYLNEQKKKLFHETAIRQGEADRTIDAICSEVIYTASMALLRDLGLIR